MSNILKKKVKLNNGVEIPEFGLGVFKVSDDEAGENVKKAFIISIRDRKNHKSPNCAFAEGAVAGALGIQLGGTNVYFGQEVYKPTIGDKLREINNGDILSTCKIMYMTAMSAVITTTALLAIKEFM